MFNELVSLLPTAQDLLPLTPSQLDGTFLKCIAKRTTNTDPLAPRHLFVGEIENLYPIGMKANYHQSLEANAALMEAWQRLMRAGLIMQEPGQAAGVTTLTTTGKAAAASAEEFEEIRERQMLQRELLHNDLQGSVWENFENGHYGTAVRDAYVQVEIAVRDAANLPTSLVGVKLMREAFNPHTGKLTNTVLPVSERERMADLFAGAIGTFKNPLSHRKVGSTEPKPVIEELLLASRLPRFVNP
jgi:uncharacterized protein (TIGR02391 family)